MSRLITLVLAAATVTGAALMTSVVVDADDGGDQAIGLDEIPAMVRSAIERATKGARFDHVEKETENGETVYEVEVSRNGHEVELTFDEKGMLVGFEVEGDHDDEEDGEELEQNKSNTEDVTAQFVPFAEIPAATQMTFRRLVGDAEISEVELEGAAGFEIYEASWKMDDVEHEAEVTADGEVAATEQVIARDVAPQAVQRVAAKAFPQNDTLTIERKSIVLYELQAEVDGEEREILVAPTGRRMTIHGEDDDDD